MNLAPHRHQSRNETAVKGENARARLPGGMPPVLVAVDLGAESCRVSLLRWNKGQPEIQLVHRFLNAPAQEEDGVHWDIHGICTGVEEGLRLCAELSPEGIAAVGVDGWAVDYVRLGPSGQPVSNPFCYRDPRTIQSQKEVHARISPERLYQLTGVQDLPLNTLYQLKADGPNVTVQNTPWTNLPEFVLQHLGGRRVSEYTNATHTQLLNIATQSWCPEIFGAAGISTQAAPSIVRPGCDVGRVEGALARLPAFRNTRLITPACHDTAAAVAGIASHGDDWAFISSGTWSLVGRVLDVPCVSESAMASNFSNEGGIGGKINFLKNVNGMWLVQQCLEKWHSQGHDWSLNDLLVGCLSLPRPIHLLEVDDPDLLLPGNMPERINRQMARKNRPTVEEGAAMVDLIFHSLAARYADVIHDLIHISGRPLKRIYVVGGGSKNTHLNRLTERATGLQVLTGPVESATIGNFAIQLAALAGDYSDAIGVQADAVANWAATLTAAPAIGPFVPSGVHVSA